jgi:uncharacterized protein (TIGR00725 family)
MRVSVIGGGRVDEATYERARTVGRICGERGHTVVCGGYGGVMEAACRGASEAGGHTVGILKGTDPSAANDYVDTPIVTGMGNGRNVLVVLTGDGVVAVDGATGTLSELALALDAGHPVAGLDTHDLSAFDGFEAVDAPEAAVESVERRL